MYSSLRNCYFREKNEYNIYREENFTSLFQCKTMRMKKKINFGELPVITGHTVDSHKTV